MLGGNGTVGGLTLESGGNAAPGNFGTLTVNGGVTFQPGSTYQVEVNAAGGSDRIAATGPAGTAMINGGFVGVLAQGGAYFAADARHLQACAIHDNKNSAYAEPDSRGTSPRMTD